TRRARAARPRASRTASAAWHLAPRLALPRIGLSGQAEYTLADHVLVDLGGAALDGVRPAAQHSPHLERHGRGVLGCRALPRHPIHVEQSDCQRLDALVEVALVHLADGALRARRPASLDLGADALVGPGPDALFAVHAHQLLAHDGIRRASSIARARSPARQ